VRLYHPCRRRQHHQRRQPRRGCHADRCRPSTVLSVDLQGLRRMTQEAKATPPEMTEAQRKEVARLFLALSPKMQAVALGCMQELIARESSNG